MTIYTDIGGALVIGSKSIPKDLKNEDYLKVLADQAAGIAQIVTFTPPTPDPIIATQNSEVASFITQVQAGTPLTAVQMQKCVLHLMRRVFGI